MKERASVIGDITVELIKKHGKKEIHTENLITGFGRSFVLANGLSTLYNAGTSQTMNKIRKVSDSVYWPNAGATTPPSIVCNVLLNNPFIEEGQGLYVPTTDELIAYSYADTTASASTEGTITSIKEGTTQKKKVTRRFAYGSDIAGEFNTIATMLTTPSFANGSTATIKRPLRGLASEDATITSVNYMKLDEGILLLNMSDSSVRQYDLATGYITTYTGTVPSMPSGNLLTIFKINNYTYYCTYTVSSHSSYQDVVLHLYGYDSTGTLVLNNWTLADSTSSVYNLCSGLIYDNTNEKYYVVTQSAAGTPYGTQYEVYVNSDGLITGKGETSDTLPSVGYFNRGCFCLVGQASSNVYAAYHGRDYAEYTFLGLDLSNYVNGAIQFFYNNGGYAVAYDKLWNTGSNAWTSDYQLCQFGNLLSYHEFATPIVKDVGDILYISYSYYID